LLSKSIGPTSQRFNDVLGYANQIRRRTDTTWQSLSTAAGADEKRGAGLLGARWRFAELANIGAYGATLTLGLYRHRQRHRHPEPLGRCAQLQQRDRRGLRQRRQARLARVLSTMSSSCSATWSPINPFLAALLENRRRLRATPYCTCSISVGRQDLSKNDGSGL
jgi:hypothetical protein